MIVYANTKGGFVEDIKTGSIAQIVQNEFESHGLSNNNNSQYRAWANSLMHMRNAIDDNDISDDVQVAIEYQIPLTSKRVDFLIAGNDGNSSNIVVVELKQWEDSETLESPYIVRAYTGGANRVVCHPSYQAFSYAKTIENFNQAVYLRNIKLQPCAFLHNYLEKNRPHIDNSLYKEATDLAPVFLASDAAKIREFIKKYVKKKDNIDLLMTIDNGKLKPAKALQDALASMLHGNQEFYLIDEQKTIFETVKRIVKASISKSNKTDSLNKKSVIVVTGGPGTGKSVVAIQLLCELIKSGYSANYVTKNAAPRNVYFEKLKGENYKLSYIKSLFKSSDAFWNAPSNMLDCVIVDEAHRLKNKSSIFYGENQVKELINSSRVSVFFIDDDQKITTKDIGSVDEINKWANFYDADVYQGQDFELFSQFRCNGSDGYLNFLDNLLEIKPTANTSLNHNDYDFKVFDSALEMKNALSLKNANNKARMIAGYCYEWVSKEDPYGPDYDIVFDDGFKAKWNFNNSIFAIDPNSFDQVGCIHTTQGLEFDYCGIIIGKDLRYENGHVITDQTAIAQSDHTSGIRSCKDKALADKLIRNTYKVLLSRGQKGCYVYCEDEELKEYLMSIIAVGH